MSLIVLVSCINQSGSEDSISAKGRFIKIMKTDNNLSKLFLKLNNDSLVVFKTLMTTDDPSIELFKNGGMDIEVIYQAHCQMLHTKVGQDLLSFQNIYRMY